jgi:hypothetical protein
MTKIAVQRELDGVFEVGAWTGRRHAFAIIAGGCSAADAECLRRVRQDRQYRALGLSWDEFCQQRVGIDRKTAESIIRRLEEFGPQYFTMAQMTGISAQDYRRIAPSIGEQGLLHAGAAIPIAPENAPKLIEAVRELTRAPLEAAPGESSAEKALAKCDRLLASAVDELERTRALALTDEQDARLRKVVVRQLGRLSLVQVTEVRMPRR